MVVPEIFSLYSTTLFLEKRLFDVFSLLSDVSILEIKRVKPEFNTADAGAPSIANHYYTNWVIGSAKQETSQIVISCMLGIYSDKRLQ